MDRKVFFSDGGVIISDSRFIASGYIYSMHDIISVRLRVIEPPRGLAVFILSIGLLFLLTEGVLFVVGGCAMAFGVMTWMFTRTTYAVILNTVTGEHKVLQDKNSDYASKVINALDAALLNRVPIPGSGNIVAHQPVIATSVAFSQMPPPLIE